MEWSQVELTAHGTTEGTCAIIWPDGWYHAERRVQILPSTVAKLTMYDSSFNAESLTEIQLLLDREDVRTLPSFEPVAMPPKAFAYYAFIVDIQRPEGPQHIGFEQLGRSEKEGYSRQDARQDDKRSGMTLQPLLQWMQSEVDRAKPNPAGRADFCSY
ncbi:MAG: hypothetical protein WBW03_07910 [Silvibacterium sp.]